MWIATRADEPTLAHAIHSEGTPDLYWKKERAEQAIKERLIPSLRKLYVAVPVRIEVEEKE